jgi:hypothetical protein
MLICVVSLELFSPFEFGVVDVYMHVAFSYMYHIMLASLYHKLHLQYTHWRCASLICFAHHDMLEIRL